MDPLITSSILAAVNLLTSSLPPCFMINRHHILMNLVLAKNRKRKTLCDGSQTLKKSKLTDHRESLSSLFTNLDFKCHFKMRRKTMERLFLLFVSMEAKETVPGRPPTSFPTVILLAVWTLTTTESFRDIAQRFDVSKGCAYRLYVSFILQISNVACHFIIWPEGASATKTISDFNKTSGEHAFPGVIGCINAFHIPIKYPCRPSVVHFNPKGFHSVILQAVCNADLMFIDIFAGSPGSLSLAEVWKKSPLYEKITLSNILPPNSYILGPSDYPYEDFLIVPYPENHTLNEKQRTFNNKLNLKRIVIDKSLEILKTRFCRLRCLDMSHFGLISSLITTTCVLHNVCILDEDDSVTLADIPDSFDRKCFAIIYKSHDKSEAATKRDIIANSFVTNIAYS